MNRKKILVIEDERDTADFLVILASQSSSHVLRAGDGQEGVDLARNELPDLILLDMRLPSMNGLEVLQALQEQPRTAGIPVLILTGTVFDAQTKALCQQVPSVKAFLPKSCGTKKIHEQIVQCLAA